MTHQPAAFLSRLCGRDSRAALLQLMVAVVSRALALPLTLVRSRREDLWVVIGRQHGLYLDNAKYFHAWLHENLPNGQRALFVTEHADTEGALQSLGAYVARYPGWRAIRALLTCGTYVFDSTDAFDHGRIGLVRGAKLVQIWHGIPLKEIELELHHRRLARLSPMKRLAAAIHKRLIKRYPKVDIMVSTSDTVTEQAFARCFRARAFLPVGYPRNDCLLSTSHYPDQLLRVNVDQHALSRLTRHRRDGGKVVLYAPTFRSSLGSPFEEGWVDLEALSQFAVSRNVYVALKLHPLMSGRYRVSDLPGVLEIDPAADIYPMLSEVDVLTTDYSSIYFDFLLLDRPIVFYPYDLDEYTENDRHLLFDYQEMTPGSQAHDHDSWLAALASAVAGDDDHWKAERMRVRDAMFRHQDAGAAERLWRVAQ